MSPSNLSRAGLVGVVAGLLGTASAFVLLFWPKHSPVELFRSPLSSNEFFGFQTFFALQHLGLVVVLVAIALSGAADGRVFRTGAWVAVIGMVILTAAEVLAMGYVDSTNDAANEGAIGALYGIASVLSGLGLAVAGVSIARAQEWTSWRRWAVLATGVWLFVAVIPGLFAGFTLGRLVIGAWMLLFAVCGWGLSLESANADSRSAASTRRPLRSTLR